MNVYTAFPSAVYSARCSPPVSPNTMTPVSSPTRAEKPIIGINVQVLVLPQTFKFVHEIDQLLSRLDQPTERLLK